MASIKPNRDKDGNIISYRWRACIARDEYGKQKFISKTFKLTNELAALTPKKLENTIQRMADEWEETEKKNKRLNIQTISDKEKFSHFVNVIWWNDHVLHNPKGDLSKATVDFYNTIKERILDSKQFKEKNLKAITVYDVNSYINDLKDQGYKASTIKHHFDVLNIILTYAYDNDYIERNPMKKAKPVIVPQEKVSRLYSDEITAFREAVDNENPKHRLMVLLMLDMGLRRGEVAGLKWKDLDTDKKVLSIRRNLVHLNTGEVIEKEPKSRNSKRDLPLPPDSKVLEAFNNWRRYQSFNYQKTMNIPFDPDADDIKIILTGEAYIFGSDRNPYEYASPQAITRWLTRFCERNNLPHYHPHMLRHTFGSVETAKRGDIVKVSRYMGHSNTTITDKKYVELGTEDLRKLFDSDLEASNQ